jgi:hypothetical protein
VADTQARLAPSADGTVTVSRGHMRARIGAHAAGLEVVPPEPLPSASFRFVTKDGRFHGADEAQLAGLIDRSHRLSGVADDDRPLLPLVGATEATEQMLPPDCRHTLAHVSAHASVRLCHGENGVFSHVVMRGDTYGEIVQVPTVDPWGMQVFSFADGHYLYSRAESTGPWLYRLGAGVWNAVPMPKDVARYVVGADADGDLLALVEGKLRRFAPGATEASTFEIVAPADAGPAIPLYVPGQDVSVGTIDRGLDGLMLSEVVLADDGAIYAAGVKGHGKYVLSTRPVARPVFVPSEIDQQARLDNKAELSPVSPACKEFFVRAEHAPKGASEAERLATLRDEVRAEIPVETTSTAVAGRLGGTFVRGLILTGPGAAETATMLATELARNPAQPSPPVCTLPELIAVAM